MRARPITLWVNEDWTVEQEKRAIDSVLAASRDAGLAAMRLSHPVSEPGRATFILRLDVRAPRRPDADRIMERIRQQVSDHKDVGSVSSQFIEHFPLEPSS